LRAATYMLAGGVLLAILASCSSPTSDEGHRTSDPGLPFSHRDQWPVFRPRSTQILFNRVLGELAPDSLQSGLHLVDYTNGNVSLVAAGAYGKAAWMDGDRFAVPDYLRGGRLYLFSMATGPGNQLNDRFYANPSYSDSLILYESQAEVWVFKVVQLFVCKSPSACLPLRAMS